MVGIVKMEKGIGAVDGFDEGKELWREICLKKRGEGREERREKWERRFGEGRGVWSKEEKAVILF